jgi:hypothetical protein
MALTLQFIPYSEISELGSARRVKKILDNVKQNKIVLLEGRLKKEEEKDLIAITMEEISEKFQGIELAVINSESKDAALLTRLRLTLMNAILGDRTGLTIIGPASIVKEIKKNPDKIELMTKDEKRRKR